MPLFCLVPRPIHNRCKYGYTVRMTQTIDPAFHVAAFYHFAVLPDFEDRKEALLSICNDNQIMGTILLASEGVNGTIAGSEDGIISVLKYLASWDGFENLSAKFSSANERPFFRMKVRLKKEIVTMGVPDVNGAVNPGQYVSPDDWDALISDKSTILIDTRNDYEVAIGTFDGAINPNTKTFRDFPKWFNNQADIIRKSGEKPKIAMFCTGGIRCEKATAYVKEQGFDDVFHLQGGILKYLENIEQSKSSFKGDCFVFDQRVAVGHGLSLSDYIQCFACRMPLAPHELNHAKYSEGVSCHHCYDDRDDHQRTRYIERQKQMQIASKKGVTHIGSS